MHILGPIQMEEKCDSMDQMAKAYNGSNMSMANVTDLKSTQGNTQAKNEEEDEDGAQIDSWDEL